ncbi:hypothetical protein [Clostridium sp. JN-1]|uniref:hypothetical protein n=1 Tax=Clostridium sp. JN-1 TaxID=2483110 RepID=UPI000F0BCEBD|nr:hypothetical protein [Clostridium sp. JN-1]
MLSFQNKMLVAQNCHEYKAYIVFTNMSALSPNCDYCVNYENESCTKNLFEKIDQIIKVN